jgi:hypothetical protein
MIRGTENVNACLLIVLSVRSTQCTMGLSLRRTRRELMPALPKLLGEIWLVRV